MIKTHNSSVVVIDGLEIREASAFPNSDIYRENTICYSILKSHNSSKNGQLNLRFDILTSHDITYVGIIQMLESCGLDRFSLPYILTNCHNSLAAVGGTRNEDDHMFGLSAVEKYGGVFVPPNQSVIHQYIREEFSESGKMILGSDSHTRYGALGAMGIGEGGGELVKQLLGETYDMEESPQVIAIYLKGKPRLGIGPQDIALTLIGEVYEDGLVKNKMVEFIGPGIKSLSMDFRNNIDTMTTEMGCLSSVWQSDEKTKEYYSIHGRLDNFKELKPGRIALYDGLIELDLSEVESMIALPFHPSNIISIDELNKDTERILRERVIAKYSNQDIPFDNILHKGKLRVNQGIIAGCAGGLFENIYDAVEILSAGEPRGNYIPLNIYPASQPILLDLIEKGVVHKLLVAGGILKNSFCGPCFGAGDIPAHQSLSVRHTTRNFIYREGSIPNQGQFAFVALMDSRSIAATIANGGILKAATDIEFSPCKEKYSYNKKTYNNSVINRINRGKKNIVINYGAGITKIPKVTKLKENLLLKIASEIRDYVTSTDDLLPSGETSTLRSDLSSLCEFTLGKRDPEYVSRAKQIRVISSELEKDSKEFLLSDIFNEKAMEALVKQGLLTKEDLRNLSFGSAIFARNPGDGSAREQAASCQKILGGWANLSNGYATSRYRGNLINWGILPFLIESGLGEQLALGDYIYLPEIKKELLKLNDKVKGYLIKENGSISVIELGLDLDLKESQIILQGGLANYYKQESG